MLVGKEMMGKSSERVGGGEEVAGVLEVGVPFPPGQQETVRQKQKQFQGHWIHSGRLHPNLC